MKFLNFKDFMKKHNLKKDTMNEAQIQKLYNYANTLETQKYIQIKNSLI